MCAPFFPPRRVCEPLSRSMHDEGTRAKNWEEIRSPGAEKQGGEGTGPQWTVGDEVTYSKKCDPYEQGGLPLSNEEVDKIRTQVPEWTLSEDYKSISKEWLHKDFESAVAFINKINILCINEGHSPWSANIQQARGAKRSLRIVLHTARLGGLSYADFMLALKLDFVR